MAGQRTGNAFLTLAAIVATLLSQSAAFADEAEVAFDIESQELGSALSEFALQSGKDILFVEAEVTGRSAPGISGRYVPTAALELLLADSNLNYRVSALDTVLVSEAARTVGGDSDSGNGRTAGAGQGPVMMAQATAEQSRTSRRTETDSDDDEKKRPLEEIIVTGTNIRGIAPESSPVRVFDREDIQISGAGTAQDFVQTLPQNFGGGSNADIVAGLPNDSNASFNTAEGSFGSSVNLRGLGSGSTLVLLNGHRLAPSSGIGDFVDISMIPTSAIERVEVLTDGASSIYGADAVAGVVNFVLRDDFEGFESSYRYGTVTEGNLDEHRASITGGVNWNTGNALLVYEFFNQTDLSAEDRTFSQGATLPNDLLPSQRRHSALVSTSQELTPNLEVFADLTYSNRQSVHDRTTATTDFFRRSPSSDSTNVSTGGSWQITDTWFVDFSGTYSAVHTDVDTSGTAPTSREVDSDILTADLRTSGSIFNLPGGEVKLALGGHFRTEGFTNFDVDDDEVDRDADRDVYAAYGEALIPVVGPHNNIPGVERFEINVSGRFEDFSDFGSTSNPKLGVLWSPSESLRVRGSYSTSFNPPPLGRVGATDLAAGPFGTAFVNSVLGLTAGDPSIADTIVLTVVGTSKDLDAEKSTAFTAGVDFSKEWGKHNIQLSLNYFDIDFENRLGSTPIPGNVTSFDAPNIAFNNPELLPAGTVIFFPSQNAINDLLNTVDRVGSSLPPGLDPLDAEIINFASVSRNLSLTFVTGFDFDATYVNHSDIGTITLGIDGTFLRDFQQQAAITTPVVEQLNTRFNPVDLRLRARAGYAHKGFSANLFLNFTDDYRVDETPNSPTIDSWTTVDLSLSYDTRASIENSILDNAVLRLSVLNLLEENPPSTPSVPSLNIFGYDPTNASPLSRFVAFEVTKRF